MLAMAIMLLLMTIVDGVITVGLIERGCEEANPLMRVLLEHSTTAFFVSKYLLTAAFLPVALVADRYRLFGTPFRVGHVMPILVILYVILIAYQYTLWQRPVEPGESLVPSFYSSSRVNSMMVPTVLNVREGSTRP